MAVQHNIICVGGAQTGFLTSGAAEREEAARAEAEAAREKEYSLHGWNINNLPRHQGSVLRYLEGEELITGVQVHLPHSCTHLTVPSYDTCTYRNMHSKRQK